MMKFLFVEQSVFMKKIHYRVKIMFNNNNKHLMFDLVFCLHPSDTIPNLESYVFTKYSIKGEEVLKNSA